MKYHNKLVRDKIPEIIENNGEIPKIRILDNNQYKQELNNKLKEEMGEYLENYEILELADVLEVIYGIININNISLSDFEQILMEAEMLLKLYHKEDLDEKTLNIKFKEKILEFIENNNKNTLATIVVIIYLIIETKDIPFNEFDQIRQNKVKERGAFNKKIFLEYVETKKSEFYNIFTKIIKEGSYNNTYKMAWAKSLVELASENSYPNGQIPLTDISKKFIKFYWNQILNNDFKQGQREPKIIKIIKELMEKYSSKYTLDRYENIQNNLKNNLETEYLKSIKRSIKVIKKDVIWRFVKIKVEYDEIYQFKEDDDYITMKVTDLKTLKENKEELINLIDYRWGLILEKFMGSKVPAKITEDNLNPEKLEKFRTYLY